VFNRKHGGVSDTAKWNAKPSVLLKGTILKPVLTLMRKLSLGGYTALDG